MNHPVENNSTNQATNPATEINPANFPPDVFDYWMRAKREPLFQEAQRQLEKEIFTATIASRYPQADLARIARWNSVPFEVVEQIAQTLLKEHTGQDLEQIEFNQAVEQIQKLEESEPDAGAREWKLQALARKYRRTPKQLMDAYNKALCRQNRVKLTHVSEFQKQHKKEVEWLVQGWMPKGVTTLLHADGGVGKTLFAYEMMECILEGKPWNGYQVEQQSVVLVQVDEPELITAERIDIRGIKPDAPLHILSDWQVEAIANLEQELAQLPAGTLIIDSITAINRNCIFSENDTEYARPILQIKELARKYGWTIILIHHSNAEGKARGTRAIHNSVDEVWALGVADVGTGDRLLRVEKTRMGRPPGRYKFSFDSEDYTFTYQGQDGDDDSVATHEEKIRLWLADSSQVGIAYTGEEVAESLEISSSVVRRCLHELWAKGILRRKRDENYKSGFRYVYSYPRVDRQNDPTDRPSDRPSDSHLEGVPGGSIGRSAKTKKSHCCEKEFRRSTDRPSPKKAENTDEKEVLRVDRGVDRSSDILPIIDNSDRPSHSAKKSLSYEKNQKVEVYRKDGWKVATYVRAEDSSCLSLTRGNLDSSHWVELGGKRVKVAESDVRSRDGA